MPRLPRIISLVLISSVFLGGCDAYENIKRAMGKGEPAFESIAPTLPSNLGPRPRILNFSKTNGFRHNDAIVAATASIEAIAATKGWTVYNTENGAVFNDEQLAQFDVIFGNNCTGDNWTKEQKSAFRRYMENGGSFVGVHGAAGTRFDYWDWYKQDLLKAQFIGHPMFPQFQTATVEFEDRTHPAAQSFPSQWQHEDEWYSFSNNPRKDGATVLATLDEKTYKAKAMGDDLSMGDHPIIWSHCINGKGRVFYSALGHSAETYQRPEHAQMLKGALAWALGLEGSCPDRQ
jgi:type 1 glutamine amidotransferase